MKEYLNTKEAAEFMGFAVQTLVNWRHQKKGPAYYKIGGAVRYTKETLMEFAQSNKKEG